jgi:hypothetical protein
VIDYGFDSGVRGFMIHKLVCWVAFSVRNLVGRAVVMKTNFPIGKFVETSCLGAPASPLDQRAMIELEIPMMLGARC